MNFFVIVLGWWVNVGNLWRAIIVLTFAVFLNDDELLLRRANGKLKYFFFFCAVIEVFYFHFILLNNFCICKLISLFMRFLILIIIVDFKWVLVWQNNIFLAFFVKFNFVVICVFLNISLWFFYVFFSPVIEHDNNVSNLFKLDNHILYQNLVTSKIYSIFDILVRMFSNDVISIKELLFNIFFFIFHCFVLVIFLLHFDSIASIAD